MKKKFIPFSNSKKLYGITLSKNLRKTAKTVALVQYAGLLLLSANSEAQSYAVQTGSTNPYSLLNDIGQVNGNANGDVIRPEIADFDKDGLLDLLAVYNDFSSSASGHVVSAKFHRNTGTATNPGFADTNTQEYFFDLDIPGLNFYQYQNQAVADIDGDSDADILFLVKYESTPGNFLCKIVYYENTSAGGTISFVKNASISTINAISASNCSNFSNMNGLIGTADLNNDGVVEIYLLEQTICGGAVTDITKYERTGAANTNTWQLAATNPVSGTFTSNPFGYGANELEFGDYDNDGDTDILISGAFGGSSSSTGIEVFLNESSLNNSFSYGMSAAPQPVNLPTLFMPFVPSLDKLAIVLKDLNNDGRADLSIGTTGSFLPAFPNQSRIVFNKSQPGTLPVKLLSFTAQKYNEKVLLNWATAMEQNSSHFEIERSNNNVNFEKIATIPASGNSAITKNYTYTDILPGRSQNYYRLKQMDKNGKFSYSPLRMVKFTDIINISMYPNPVRNGETIHINFQNITTSKIEMITMAGQVLYSNSAKLTGNLSIPLSPLLAPGIYLIRVMSGNGIYIKRFAIQ